MKILGKLEILWKSLKIFRENLKKIADFYEKL